MKTPAACIVIAFMLSGCVQKPGQDVYQASEIGVSRAVEFGTVIVVREVQIIDDKKGTGALLGAGVGGGAASYTGGGSGRTWAIVGGAIVGAIVGNAIEEQAGKRTGYEYTVSMLDGETKIIVQEKIEGDVVFKPGDKVMLQYCDAGKYNKKCTPDAKDPQFQRLLPVDEFPPEIKKSKRKKRADSSEG